MESLFEVRRLNQNDFEVIFNWRRDQVTRKMSRYTGEVVREKFAPVFAKYLKNLSYLVSLRGGDPVGFVIFTEEGDNGRYEVGINLNPAHRGQGYSKKILALVIEKYLDRTVVQKILAAVKKENIPSIKLFIGVGFKPIESDDDQFLHFLYE